jgi:16S rRNA processing protein RimM
VVGRIIRPHGVRGEVSVEVRTDRPEQRFAAGSRLVPDPAGPGPLTVSSARWHAGRLLVRFTEIADRSRAEPLRGAWLTVDADQLAPPTGEHEFHDHHLTGLTVVTVTGELVGTVSTVRHYGQDLLVVEPADRSLWRSEVLVPFVAAIVVAVDLAGGRLVIDPPPGLLELSVASPRQPGGGEPR